MAARDSPSRHEADHFGNCPVCGALIDMRDLAQVLAHVHDAEIEVGEGPESPERAGDGAVEKSAVINGRLRN